MKVSLIAALSNNYVIGRSNSIPWFLPNDMLWFRYHTRNKPVVMGRKTFDSLGRKPLVNRLNIVLSRKVIINREGVSNVFFVKTPKEAWWMVMKVYGIFPEIMVIGGREIYDIFFLYVSRLYLTCIDVSVYGDTFFPFYNFDEWKVIFNQFHSYAGIYYTFKIFERV